MRVQLGVLIIVLNVLMRYYRRLRVIWWERVVMDVVKVRFVISRVVVGLY